MINARRVLVLGVALVGLLPSLSFGQELMPYSSNQVAQEAPPPAIPLSNQPPMQAGEPPMMQGAPPIQVTSAAVPQAGAPAYTQEQLDQLLAPIALYPDPLLSSILMASTYPLEVAEAQRWLQADPQNAQLKGDQLQAALAQEPWDPSVKSLIAFPQVLNMMNNNLQWTEQLGDAFLANQAAVMTEVQGLRQRAQAAGNLKTTPQETVTEQQGAIMIEPPPQQQMVYVPYYDPAVVYGVWPYPAYAPYYFPPPPGYIYATVGLIGFGFGIGIVDWLWGWNHWDWYHHRIDIDPGRWEAISHHAPVGGGVWEHNPEHRHGVPYRSAAARAQYGGAAAAARSNFRGYFNQSENRVGVTPAARTNAGVTGGARPAGNIERPAAQSTPMRSSGASNFTRPAQETSRAQPASTGGRSFSQQRSAPMYESFSRGSEVRAQSMRGASSRAAMPAASHSAPAGGNRGGGGRGNEGRNR